MTISKYLIINSRGGISIKERYPNLNHNEISLRLYLEIPNEFFQRPRLEAIMKVPKEAMPKVNITPEITTNIEKIIKSTVGLTMKVNIVDQKEENNKK